ncbi:hypothetical protein DCAR_0830635 [Daucus carota subsp. sativus]|uniref:Basic leucine-zipper C-terminal domain-containing protein n=1 Tax=Daucus carota subsp. sativus TaxID=79200 RepID=A0AAF0XN47_DAUCS|nr:hypothetical protein DCAR_0830635 [Daucus carota subsp. sativus]
MAEETVERVVERVTGLNPMFQAMLSEISTIGMPSYSRSPSDTLADTIQDVLKQHFYYLDHLQKRIRGGVGVLHFQRPLLVHSNRNPLISS